MFLIPTLASSPSLYAILSLMEEERETEGWKWIETIEGVGEGRKRVREIEGSEIKRRK